VTSADELWHPEFVVGSHLFFGVFEAEPSAWRFEQAGCPHAEHIVFGGIHSLGVGVSGSET
jgi:hypothetical protein